MPKLRVAKVFIASPSDLSEERRLFPSIIEHVNEIKARSMNYVLQAVGWKDSLPGFGRPQEIINKDVRQCDIFVMLLWKRWGQPTGKHSSGTEEEFTIARERYAKTKHTPNLLLYFRSVPRSMMADPGEQLLKVIDFRTSIEAERLCLYETYDRPAEWKDLLVTHLCKWLDIYVSGRKQGEVKRRIVRLSSEGEGKLIEMQNRLEAMNAELQVTQGKLRTLAVTFALEAMKFIDEGKFTMAEERFAKSVELYEEPEVLNNYGRFLFQIASLDRAKEIFEKLYLEPNAEEIHRANACLGLAKVYEQTGDTSKAEEMLRIALQYDSLLNIADRLSLQLRLGNLLLIRSDLRSAEKAYQKSLEIASQYDSQGSSVRSGKHFASLNKDASNPVIEGYVGLGNVHLTKGSLNTAEELFETAMAICNELNRDEDVANILVKLGIIHSRRGDFKKATATLKNAVKLFRRLGNDEEVEQNLARISVLKDQGLGPTRR